MLAKAVVHQKKVKIHYQHVTRAKRINTGVAVTSSLDLSKEGKLKSSVVDRDKKQVKINKFKSTAQDLIDHHFHKYEHYPTGEEFDKLWINRDNYIFRSEKLLEHYKKYLAWKPKDREIKKLSSLKDYNSLLKNLTDYEEFLEAAILLGDINTEWLGDFEDYLKGSLDISYTSKTNHNLETRKKRIRTLKGFYKWLDLNDIFDMPKALRDFKHEKTPVEIVKAVLTKDELRALYNYHFEDYKKTFIRDVFVFSCHTGLRFSDLISLRKRHLKKLPKAGLTISKKAEKTGYEFNVPVNSVALEILEKYSYNLSEYTNANFNKYLHLLLKETEMFDDELEFNEEVKKRWKCISIHRGRDTFITLLIQERVPLNEIMKYTGHRSVTNLNKYIDLKGEVLNFTKDLI